MTKRRAHIALLFVSLILPAVAEIPTISAIRARGELVCAAENADNPPYLYREGGVWRGIDAELIRDISASIGVPWSVRAYGSLDECVLRMARGDADLLVSGRRSNYRDAAYLCFSKPYRTISSYLLIDRSFFARKEWGEDNRIENRLAAHGGARIGLEKRSSARKYVSSLRDADIREYESQRKEIGDLLEGKIRACVVDADEYDRLCLETPESLIFVRPIRIEGCDEDVCLAAHWKDREFVQFVDIILAGRGTNE